MMVLVRARSQKLCAGQNDRETPSYSGPAPAFLPPGFENAAEDCYNFTLWLSRLPSIIRTIITGRPVRGGS
jgi:hypothetical protein